MPGTSSYRYEFRIFSPDLGTTAETLMTVLRETGASEQRSLYLLGLGDVATNLKIRDRRLERKTCIEVTDDGLQKWRPDSPREFPLDPPTCKALFGLGCDRPLGLDEVAAEVCRPSGQGVCMHLLKHRRHFERDEVLGEHCRLVVNGAAVESVAIESTDARSLADCRRALDLVGVENTSYVVGLGRIAGLEPLPESSRWRFDANG